MTAEEFAELMKEQAKLHGIEGFELESAAGYLLTTTVKERALATNDDVEIIRRLLFVIATIMKCFCITTEMLADPQTIKILKRMGEMLDENSPPIDETLQ